MYNSLRQNGLSAGEAMTQCGVPNHFRARDEFKNSIEKFKPVHIMRFLSRLYDFDVAMRNNDESITQQLFIKLIISTCA
ncbi:MAG TPA: hypothetical protein DC049_09280 [Spirochaetia bacterium]|nr:hypothetical protein [Spirochaetia bacterium]